MESFVTTLITRDSKFASSKAHQSDCQPDEQIQIPKKKSIQSGKTLQHTDATISMEKKKNIK